MLLDVALGFANHVLTGEEWARRRLSVFAGQTARLELGALGLPLVITADGLFRASDSGETPAVTISLSPQAPMRALLDRSTLLSDARISGSAELAECLGFVFRNLRWDIEEDLSRVVGDIAARRLVQGGKRLAAWQMTQAKNLALNVAEYFTEETPAIARSRDVAAHCAAVQAAQQSLADLERRIAVLERRA